MNDQSLGHYWDYLLASIQPGYLEAHLKESPFAEFLGEGPAEHMRASFRQEIAIICSMTLAERAEPSIVDLERKQRIARGSGTTIRDVRRALGEAKSFSAKHNGGPLLPWQLTLPPS